MRFDVLTLFPDFFRSPLESSLIGKAVKRGIVEVRITNVRDYAPGVHRVADDTPYGGGSGMVMRAEPLVAAIEAASEGLPAPRRLLLSPRGRRFRQAVAEELAREARILVGLRALRRGRRAGPPLRRRRAVDRRLRSGRRRNGRPCRRRGGRAAATRRASATRDRWKRNRFAAAFSSTRSTRGRKCFASWRCPRSCSPGITARSLDGGGSSVCG